MNGIVMTEDANRQGLNVGKKFAAALIFGAGIIGSYVIGYYDAKMSYYPRVVMSGEVFDKASRDFIPYIIVKNRTGEYAFIESEGRYVPFEEFEKEMIDSVVDRSREDLETMKQEISRSAYISRSEP